VDPPQALGWAAADDRLFARFHGLHRRCARLAGERPLAVLVDDAHWADEHSLRFLAYLEARIEEIPACVVLAVRTGESAVPEALTRLIKREPLTAVRPLPLSPAAIAELVRGSLGSQARKRTMERPSTACARTVGMLDRRCAASMRPAASGMRAADSAAP
jgi:predicted ATPase